MKTLFKIVCLIVWLVVLFSYTCTKDLDKIILFQSVHFAWNPHPRFSDLLKMRGFKYEQEHFLFIKAGHFCGFGILDFLLFYLIKKKKTCLFLSIGFGAFTEILQLYFYRDGRLFDIAIDSAGALLMFFLIGKYQKTK